MSNPTIDRLRIGMRVMSADGHLLGIVCRLAAVDGYTFVEVVSDRDLWKLALRTRRLYLPMSAVTEVLANHVVLSLEARAAKAFTARPAAPAHETQRVAQFAGGAGGWDWGGNWSGGSYDGGGACGLDGGLGGDGGCGY